MTPIITPPLRPPANATGKMNVTSLKKHLMYTPITTTTNEVANATSPEINANNVLFMAFPARTAIVLRLSECPVDNLTSSGADQISPHYGP